ncbi:MAG: CopG family transcriptional regulator [Methylococcales bacterium]|nr:CopG family transcriptional regulator [Methylococcales bacterium]
MTADEIANLADQGEDISKHFTNNGAIRHPIQRVNVDFPLDMLSELDSMAKNMNISRQALIKMTLRQYLDNHYLALSKVV